MEEQIMFNLMRKNNSFTMKKLHILPIVTLLMISIFSNCSHEDSGSVLAESWPLIPGRYMITEKNASVLCASMKDEPIDTGAYTATIGGKITFVDTSITVTRYGHCWSTQPNPVYHKDSSTTITDPKEDFQSNINGLKMLTDYYVRTYVVINDTLLGYNPEILKITTETDENIWLNKTGFGSAVVGAVTFTIDSVGYVGLGKIGTTYHGNFWKYDPAKSSWAQISTFKAPTEYGTPRDGAVAFVLKGKAYVGLGENIKGRLDDFYEYNPKSNAWVEIITQDGLRFPGKRSGAVAFAIGEFGYVGTGRAGINSVVGDFYKFRLADHEAGRYAWDISGGIPVAREHAVVFVIADRAYIGSGLSEDSVALKDFYEYIPQNDSWSTIPEFPGEARYDAFSFSIWKDYLSRGEGYVGGGRSKSGVYNDVYVYIPELNQWRQRTDFLGGPNYGGAGFTVKYQRFNESFKTEKGFVVGGHNGDTGQNRLFEFLP